MNLLTVIVIIIIILCVLKGYRNGLAKGLASMVSLIASLVLVFFLMPQVSEFLEDNTPVYGYVLAKCEQTFTFAGTDGSEKKNIEKEKVQQAAEGIVNIAGADSVTETDSSANKSPETAGKTVISSADAKKLLANLALPELVKNMLLENNTPEKYLELAVESFYDYVPKFMASLIMNAISFIVTWIIVLVLLRILMGVLGMVNDIPIVGGINRLLGAALGLVQGIVIVWVAFLIITTFSSTAVGKQLLDMIEESAVLKELYNTNLLMDFLQNTMKTFF